MSYVFTPFQKKELSKLKIDNTRQKMGWVTIQKMSLASEVGLSLQNEEVCVGGRGSRVGDPGGAQTPDY